MEWWWCFWYFPLVHAPSMLAATPCFIFTSACTLDRTCRCKHVQRTSIFKLPNIYGTKQIPPKPRYQNWRYIVLEHSIVVSLFFSITKGHLVSPEPLTSEVKPPNALKKVFRVGPGFCCWFRQTIVVWLDLYTDTKICIRIYNICICTA